MDRQYRSRLLLVAGVVVSFVALACIMDRCYAHRYREDHNKQKCTALETDSLKAEEGDLLVIRRITGDSIIVQSATDEDVEVYIEGMNDKKK
jgi:hypothetical protein